MLQIISPTTEAVLCLTKLKSTLQVSKQDWLVWMVVLLGCLFVGIEWGLLFGVTLSVLTQLGYIVFPSLHVLGRLPSSTTHRSIHTNASAGSFQKQLSYIVFPSLHVLECLVCCTTRIWLLCHTQWLYDV